MNPVVVRNVRIGEGIPKICVPIVGKTKEEILQAAEEIRNVPADLVEWRADWFESVFEIEEVKNLTGELRDILGELPILFTFRTKKEGGEKDIDTKQYVELNSAVVATGNIDLIDVEMFSMEKVAGKLIEIAHQHGVKVIGSNHDFAMTPDQHTIVLLLCAMQDLGADIPKLAVMPQNKEDVTNLLGATAEMVSEYADRPIITMSMGGLGTVSRVSGEIFGSAVTFGSVGKASAPGQMDVNELKKVLEILHRAQ